MRSFREIPAVRRLNAPTRAAAARRRRLRKGSAASLVALATLIVASPSSGNSENSRPHSSPHQADLHGRHLMSLPADPALMSSLPAEGRVDLWDPQGQPLARSVPALKPDSASTGFSAGSPEAHLLVALNATEVRRVSLTHTSAAGDAPAITLTISPR